jgi:VanZ family protein
MIFLGLWFFIILVVSVIPASGPETDLPADKIAHFAIYGLTSILLFRYFRKVTTGRSAFYKAVALTIIYGAAMELVQHLLPYRSFSLGDIAANSAGAFLMCLVYKQVKH